MPRKAEGPDLERLRKALPYEIVPTRLPGVYTSPPPPADLDLDTADAKTLAKHGVLWRRPTAKDPKKVRALWERVTSRKWEPIIPVMEVQFGKTHTIKKNRKKTEAGYTSNRWSGGVVVGPPGSYTSAIGIWDVPFVGIPPEPQGHEGGWNSSSWVGIDGWGTNDVLQAGIQQKVDASGKTSYVAWYEWFVPVPPADPTLYPYVYQTNIPNFKISPGDKIFCSVSYVGNTAGQLWIANDTAGQTSYSTTLAPPNGAAFNGSDAEWIMEAPDGGEPTSSLPSFSPVVFDPALACNNTGFGTGNFDYVNVVGFGKQLTSVTLGNLEVTIDFTG
jgi:hypothetical protein